MKPGFKRFMKRGQKGVTLVELMVVMAILAVLASIIFPAVSGTQEKSVDSQVGQDASTVGNAMSDFFAKQTGAEVITSAGAKLLAAASANTTVEQISSRWPENYITSQYANVFVSDNVTSITGGDAQVNNAWIAARTAINFYKAGSGGLVFVPTFMPTLPDGASTDAMSGQFNNYLWLAEKTTASGGAENGSRQLEVWKLTNVTQTGSGANAKYALTYQQLY